MFPGHVHPLEEGRYSAWWDEWTNPKRTEWDKIEPMVADRRTIPPPPKTKGFSPYLEWGY